MFLPEESGKARAKRSNPIQTIFLLQRWQLNTVRFWCQFVLLFISLSVFETCTLLRYRWQTDTKYVMFSQVDFNVKCLADTWICEQIKGTDIGVWFFSVFTVIIAQILKHAGRLCFQRCLPVHTDEWYPIPEVLQSLVPSSFR